MRRPMSTLLSVLVLLSSALLVTDAPALGAGGIPCNGEVDLTISPGLSNSPSSGTWASDGERGTISCTGKVNGYDVTGPGTFSGHGRYGTKDPDTCGGGGEADGPQFLAIPTTGGMQRITNEHFSTFGPLRGCGVVGGEFTGPRFSGTFQAQPIEGDCISAPVTKVHFSVKGTLTD